jgi:hypothetical protein
VHVKGRDEVVFVKVHTHGAQELNMRMLFDYGLERLYSLLENHWNDGEKYQLHYMTAREMFNVVKALERGESGNPGLFRDYLLLRD